ncbi:MAG: chemotaxis protein CheW [Rubrivivax sp.]|nr:chemotaxis protein CheW [Rubrivivax sp.]
MAQREALRDLQARLAERLQAARTSEGKQAWLAVEAGPAGILLPLEQAGEIFPLGEILPLPHARPWFLGVANLRGGLHGVVDLAGFLGLRPNGGAGGPAREGGRLVALNPVLRSLVALRIDHMSGLRRADDMTAVPLTQRRPPFAGRQWRDAQGRPWLELDLAELAASPAFIAIAAEETA